MDAPIKCKNIRTRIQATRSPSDNFFLVTQSIIIRIQKIVRARTSPTSNKIANIMKIAMPAPN